MWPFQKTKEVFLTNTLTGAKEVFTPLVRNEVRMYSCGPTVYGPQHVGNLRAAVFSDLVARTLALAGYRVKRVVNITDVGQLVGDGDDGEDKMTVGAKRESKTPREIADRYTKQYLADIEALNIDISHVRFPRATDYIRDQIEMIQILEKKGLTYRIDDGVYFDTERFPKYGVLGGMHKAKLVAGARVAIVQGKKNPADFALWRNALPHDLQQWQSPWGLGNPGWSIECSAMAKALLGVTLDIHTGGEDHIHIHHNNEIAQSEGANGKPLARFWLHNAFLTISGEKISKSLGNTYILQDVTNKGIHPLALRYFFLQAHYRSPLSFSWEALQGAHDALSRLWEHARGISTTAKGAAARTHHSAQLLMYMRDDIGTPRALAKLWEVIQDARLSAKEKYAVLKEADGALGLSLLNPPVQYIPRELTLEELPDSARLLAEEREEARKEKDFARADALRKQIDETTIYQVRDSAGGTTFVERQPPSQ